MFIKLGNMKKLDDLGLIDRRIIQNYTKQFD